MQYWNMIWTWNQTEQTLVSSERGREAAEEGKSDLFSSFLCKKTTQFDQLINAHILYCYLQFLLNLTYVYMQKILSEFLILLSHWIFFICMLHTNQFIQHAIFLQAVNKTHLFLITPSVQAFRNSVCPCMHSSMNYLEEYVRSNKHLVQGYTVSLFNALSLSSKRKCFSVH